MKKRWGEYRTSNDGEEDRLIRSIMKRDVEIPAEVIEKKRMFIVKSVYQGAEEEKNAREYGCGVLRAWQPVFA